MAKLSYPWHASLWQRLEAYLRQGRIPQGLLISGPRGVGKGELARYFAARMLCGHGKACGICPACRLLAAGSHPDLIVVAPEADGPLTVEQIRELIEMLALTPQYDRGRVVILEAADRMNAAAANSFLKTLEEPVPGTVILLLCQLPSRLPATILSRCQHLKLPVPPAPEAIAWLVAQGVEAQQAELALALNGGAPLLARSWLDSDAPAKRQRFLATWDELLGRQRDPLVLALAWQEEPLESVVNWSQALVADLVRLKQGDTVRLLNPDRREWLQDWARRLDLDRVLRLWQWLLELREALQTQLNRTLLLESLFLQIHGLRP